MRNVDNLTSSTESAPAEEGVILEILEEEEGAPSPTAIIAVTTQPSTPDSREQAQSNSNSRESPYNGDSMSNCK